MSSPQRLTEGVSRNVALIAGFPWSNSRGQRLVQYGVEKAAAVGVGGGELRGELVTEGHELINFGDDAVLFGDRWYGDWEFPCVCQADIWLSINDLRSHHVINS